MRSRAEGLVQEARKWSRSHKFRQGRHGGILVVDCCGACHSGFRQVI